MKKFLALLSFVFLMLFIMPMNTHAAIKFTLKDDWYVSDGEISAGSYGKFAAGRVRWKYTNETEGIKTWEFYLTPGANVKAIFITLVPNALEIQNIEAGETFLRASKATNPKVLLIPNSSVTQGKEVLLFTVTTKDTAKEGCMLSVSPGVPSCIEVDGTYLDKDGNSVTEEEYNASCSGVTPSNPQPGEDVPNSPDTGIPVPYIAVGGGLIAIAGVYLYSRKKNKVYKI